VSLDRFKSFKHVNLLLNRGFNCVVGPNGSGKSNICDAILFGLGEGSLRRLRVNRLEYLINAGTARKKNSPLAKAYVRLEFGGDADVSISRGVRADGKTAYRLDGKRMTRSEVLEVLKSHNVHVDETSTISQGEINRLINLNSKERSELIELASGIKEFEFKKREAISELGKVETRLGEANVILGERLGFIRELEKDKLAAESYIAMTKRLRIINYSIFTKRSASVQLAIGTYAKDAASFEARKKEIEAQLAELTARSTKLLDERQRLNKVLSESSAAAGDTSKRLEAIGGELSALDVRMQTGKKAIEDAERRLEEIAGLVKEIDGKLYANDGEVSSFKRKIDTAEADLKGVIAAASKGDTKAADRVKEATDAIRKLEDEIADLQEGFTRLATDLVVLASGSEGSAKEVALLEEEASAEKGKAAEAKEELKGFKEETSRIEKQLEETVDRMNEVHAALSKADTEFLSLKEQRAAARPRDGAMQDRVRSMFGGKPGFYGTAAELCNYDGKYGLAVEAAAGSRLNYFVVESMSVANTVIDYLKKQNLGRATFIPLQELVTEDRRKDGSMEAVVDLLKFEQKFAGAFNYIFSDTYLVDGVEEAKRAGVGRHRYVTLSGETVERSGVLSGGSASRNVSVAALEKRLADLEKTRQALSSESAALEGAAFELRKELAAADMSAGAHKTAISDAELRLRDLTERISRARSEAEKAESGAKSMKKKRAEMESELKAKSETLRLGREALAKSYGETLKESVAMAKGGVGSKEAERLEALRKEMEDLRIRSAELQRESKMLMQNKEALVAERKLKEAEIKGSREALKADAARKSDLAKQKEKVDAEVKNSSKANKDSFDRVNKIDTEMQSISKEQGKLGAAADDVARRLGELEVKKGQMEMRLNDIRAELAAFGAIEGEVIDEEIEKMERESGVLNARIADLGSVNLKAPEIYEEKKRSVEEANEKVATLDAERRAVLAMMEEINSKKIASFMSTFDEVNKNFAKLYNYIFPGAAHIELEDANDPLNSGIEIRIENGRSFKRVGSFSGGEKSLLSLMLLFAIHMCKPSAIYLFDEIDAALDKENSKKLSQLIKEMAKQAQFIVVSHNDSLIASADAAIGVIRAEDESKAVGIEISSLKNKQAAVAGAATGPGGVS
jgi:chromosome segregation protein